MASKKRKLIEGLIPKKKTSGKPKTKTDAMSEEAKVREKHPDATHAEILKIIKKEKAAKRARARKRAKIATERRSTKWDSWYISKNWTWTYRRRLHR